MGGQKALPSVEHGLLHLSNRVFDLLLRSCEGHGGRLAAVPNSSNCITNGTPLRVGVGCIRARDTDGGGCTKARNRWKRLNSRILQGGGI